MGLFLPGQLSITSIGRGWTLMDADGELEECRIFQLEVLILLVLFRLLPEHNDNITDQSISQ